MEQIRSGSRSSYVMVTTEDGGKQAVCAVNLSFRTDDKTVAHVESVSLDKSDLKFSVEKVMTGSSSSGKGGGGSSRSVTENAANTNSDSTGTWILDNTGWWFKRKDGSYPAACWQQLTYNGISEWYHFDEKGYMQTGWFTDTDGNRYYLHAVGDGTRGALFVSRETPDGYRVDASGAWIM